MYNSMGPDKDHHETNHTSVMVHERSSDPLHIWMHVQSGLLGVILIIALLLNTLLVIVLRKMKSRRSKKDSASFSIERSYMMLLFHLAFADMLGVSLNIPFDILKNAGVKYWLSPFMCTMLGPVQLASTSAQAGTYVALSYHRFRAIVYPIRANLTVRKSLLFIGIIWTAGVCLSLPYAVVQRIVDNDCMEKWPQGALSSNIYTFAIFILQYAAPVTLMAIFYITIARTLQMHRTAKEQIHIPAKDDLRAHRHIVKMLVTIVTVYSVCMLPHHVLFIIDGLLPMGNKIFQIGIQVAYLFTYSNTVSNPAVFFWYNSESRYHLRQIFKKLRCYKEKLNKPFEFDVDNLMGNSMINTSKIDSANYQSESPVMKTSKLDSKRLTQLFPTATEQGVSLPWEAQVLSSSDDIKDCYDASLSYSAEDAFLCTMPQTGVADNLSECSDERAALALLDAQEGERSDNGEALNRDEIILDVEHERGVLPRNHANPSATDTRIIEDNSETGTKSNKGSRKNTKTVNFSKNGEIWDNGEVRGIRTKQDKMDCWDRMLSTGGELNNNVDNNSKHKEEERAERIVSCSLVENKDMTESHDLVNQMIGFLESAERDYRALQEHLRNLPEEDV